MHLPQVAGKSPPFSTHCLLQNALTWYNTIKKIKKISLSLPQTCALDRVCIGFKLAMESEWGFLCFFCIPLSPLLHYWMLWLTRQEPGPGKKSTRDKQNSISWLLEEVLLLGVMDVQVLFHFHLFLIWGALLIGCFQWFYEDDRLQFPGHTVPNSPPWQGTSRHTTQGRHPVQKNSLHPVSSHLHF